MDRFRSRARVAAALFAAATLAALPSPPTRAAGAGAGPDRQQVDEAVAFREKLGLPAGRAFVEATFGRRDYSSARWGVPLDAAEAGELGRRVDAQRALGKAVRAWATEPVAAGAFVDQRAGGVVVFLTADDPGAARGAIAKLLPGGPTGPRTRFERVARSTVELLAVQARVDADVRAGALASLDVRSTAIDTRSNAVVVGLSEVTAAARAALAARYGDAVRAEQEGPAQGGDDGDPCLSRKDCPPAKGGIEIRSDYNGANCTTGFLVRVVGSPEARILTAGHCVGRTGGTGTSRTWTQGGVDIGWSELTTWFDGADADAGIVAPLPGAVEGDRNLLFRASSSDVVPVASWRPTAEQIQGGLVCRAGVTSGYHCGTISLTNRTKAVDGRTIDHQWVVDFDACPGDSGGPYVLDDVAYGIHSDSSWGCDPSTNQAWYSPVGWVLDVLAKRGHPVVLCTTAACGSETNVWSSRGSLDAAVWGPRLVPLSDGRVLLVGGDTSDPMGPQADAGGTPPPSLFDPLTGAWTDAATSPWAPATCAGQFAVGLADGRVLVGGGRQLSGPHGACDGAYLFDPAGDPAGGPEGAWSAAAAPPVDLEWAGAALLPDGRAFVTAGTGTDGGTSVALAYSPAGDAWATLAPAPAGAIRPLVLGLADGRVLVAGGHVLADPAAGVLADVTGSWLYDPSRDAWSASKAVGADAIAGTVLRSGRVVVAGGRHLAAGGGETLFATVRLLDPATGTWTDLAPMRMARAGASLVELANGQLLAAGGRGPGPDGTIAPTTRVEVYDWSTKGWHEAPPMAVARSDHAGLVLPDGVALVAGGGSASTESYVPGDVLPPSATGPSVALRSGARMSSSAVPIRLSWTATDAGGSGVGTYDIGRSTDGGAFTTIATSIPTPTWDTTVAGGHAYRFQVRPRDWAGNAGAWRAGPTVRLGVTQESSAAVKYAGTWKRATVGGFDGGSMRYAKVAGASATLSFTGRGIAYVGSRGPNRGAAKVYVDGSLVATVNLYAGTLSYRHVLFQRTWSGQGSHRIKVVVVGTRGHPLVDVDAFVVLSLP